jgi:hypothetical protein
MLVLLVSVALLFGAPALLLWMGRLIARRTDFRNRETAVETVCSGEEWYFRAPASLAGNAEVAKQPPADQAWPDAGRVVAWYRRPSRPLVEGFPWFRIRREHA